MNRLDLVAIDGVAHARIHTLVDNCAKRSKDLRRFANPIDWNIRVDVAAPQKDRRAVAGSGIGSRRPGRTDDSPAQPNDPAVSARIPRGEFKRKAGALRESKQHDTTRGHVLALEHEQEPLDRVERRTE